jgi:hypothetical protein
MNKIIALLLLITNLSYSQIGIGTIDVDGSSILEVESNNRGFLPPRMTEDQRDLINNPAVGLLIYCTDCCTQTIGAISTFTSNNEWILYGECPKDTDMDGILDSEDIDADNDGILNVNECPQPIAEVDFSSVPLQPSQISQLNNPALNNDLDIRVHDNGQLQVYIDGDQQFYNNNTPAELYNSLILKVGSTRYKSANAGGSPTWYGTIDLVQLSTSSTVGDGTPENPFAIQVQQYADINTNGTYDPAVDFKLIVDYIYVSPNLYFDIVYKVVPPPTNTQEIKLFHFMDTYLAGGDKGPAIAFDDQGNDITSDPDPKNPKAVGVYKSDNGSFFGLIEKTGEFDRYYSGQQGLGRDNLLGMNLDLNNELNTDPNTDNGIIIQYNLGTPQAEVKRSAIASFDLSIAIELTNLNEGLEACDKDMDGIPNYLDLDSDNDGIPDNVEAQENYTVLPTGMDSDSNGLDDAYEPNGQIPFNTAPVNDVADYLNTDSDNDGTSDTDEASITLTGNDTDKDGLDDATDATSDYSDPNGTLF